MNKCLFIDIDGTLYSHTQMAIPPKSLQALAYAKQKGYTIYIATGRHPKELIDLNIQDLKVDGFIYLNGALVIHNDEILFSSPLDKDDLITLTKILKSDPFSVQFMEKDRIFVNQVDDVMVAGLPNVAVKPLALAMRI